MNMLERAARAMCEFHHSEVCVGVPPEEYWEQSRDTFTLDASAALLAALDPEDEALETAIASAMAPEIFEALRSTESIADAYRLSHDAREFRQHARAAITAIRALASDGIAKAGGDQ